MAGLPKKYAKMGFAKGWAAYRAASGKKKKTAKKKTSAKRQKKNTLNKAAAAGGSRMARRKKSVKRRTRRAIVATRRAASRARNYIRRKPALSRGIRILVDGVSTAGGVVAGNAVMNYTPMIKEVRPEYKAAIQAGAGVVTLVVSKNRALRFVGAGMVLAGFLNAAKQIPALARLAGTDSDLPTLSPGEMAALTMGSNARYLESHGMGVPARLGVPETLGDSFQNNYPDSSW